MGYDFIKATAFLLVPTELLYFSIYFHTKGQYRIYKYLTFLSLVTFWISPWAAPISCSPARTLQNFAIAIGTMKLLDIWARRNSLPTYTAGRRPADWLLALIILTELRYESFTPNHVRVPRDQENFNEPLQLAIHLGAFLALQSFPQNYPTVLAFEVLLSIYIIWTSMQLVLRYKSSPALFGPLYKIDSLTGFWSESWHNVFASPCTSLAYSPLRYGLPRMGVPIPIARSLGVLGAFTLMAAFHMYALAPMLSQEALNKIGLFFVLNGIATVAEALVWGHRKHWLKTAMAWAFQVVVASWTAEGLNLPNGLSKIPWRELCEPRAY
ncbi:hypothetical protein BP6252_05385 [Coleophoma cylindrospora]|uniref:Wax synthase domain-containing protein n=1 Tax=Coleophoma cylindrospora TaxID=1849047 RepID=A0A3D8RTB1_9HELO|nr:hypothetical protein BP6252_05385 [Coleophoma cylindrospora]